MVLSKKPTLQGTKQHEGFEQLQTPGTEQSLLPLVLPQPSPVRGCFCLRAGGEGNFSGSMLGIKLPLKGVFALGPEEIHVGFELQLEDIILLNAIRLHGGADHVAEQWEAGQGIIVLQQPNSTA